MDDKQMNTINKVLKRFKFFTFLLISLLLLYLGIFLFVHGSAITSLLYIMLWLLSLLFIGAFYNKRGIINAFIFYLASSYFIFIAVFSGSNPVGSFDPLGYLLGNLIKTDYNIIYITCSNNVINTETGDSRIVKYSICPEGMRGKYSVINNKIVLNNNISIDMQKKVEQYGFKGEYNYTENIYLHNTSTNTRKRLSLQEAQEYSIVRGNGYRITSPDGFYIQTTSNWEGTRYYYYLTTDLGNKKKLDLVGFERPEYKITIGWVKK